MRNFLKKPYLILASLAVFLLALTCFTSQDVSASALKVKDGQKLCGTFTFNVKNDADVKKQDFQICAVVDGSKNFKSTLELRTGNWNNSIAYVDQNSNIINIYDSPNNAGSIIGGKPCTGLPHCGDHKQFVAPKAEDKESFETYLQSIKKYLNGLKNRQYHYWANGQHYTRTATFKNQIDWSKEDVTADSSETTANRKAQCEQLRGGTWTGNSAKGYQCVDADGNVIDESLSVAAATNSTGSGNNNACYGSAGALGWFLCPVIQVVGGAVNGIYGFVEDNFLKIPSDAIFDTQSDSGTYYAWSTFRDIANIAFIILFLIVIFSQLTGYGIDNYGIKKILPKLVVVAILINLSYIICQFAVDISNIIGVSLRGFTEGLGSGLNDVASTNFDTWSVAGGTALGLVTAAIGAGAVFLTDGAILIGLVGAIVGAAIAVLFLFVILIIREVGVILAIVIAPLAIACYLLPNTESLGKKWLKISGALLVLYPLCSLVIGVGNLASVILVSTNSGWYMAIAAMIAQVLPYFFIPTLLRQSLNGIGNLGARIGNFGRAQGRQLGGRANTAVRNSNWGQNRRFNAMQRRTGIRLGAANHANSDNGNRVTRGIARLVGGSQRTQARYIGQRAAAEEEELKNSRALANEQMRNLISQNPAQPLETTYSKALQDAVDSGDKNRIMGMMSAIEQSNMSGSQKNKVLRQAFEQGGLQIGGDANTHADVLRSVAQQHQGLMAADPELMRWANAGGMDNSGNKADLSGYAAANMSAGDVDDKDLDGVNKAHLENLIQHGIITQNQAKRHWANGGGKSDTERLMFGSAGDGHTLTVSEAESILKLTGNGSYTAANGRTYTVADRDGYLKRNAQEVTIV